MLACSSDTRTHTPTRTHVHTHNKQKLRISILHIHLSEKVFLYIFSAIFRQVFPIWGHFTLSYITRVAPCLISLISSSHIISFEKVNSSNCFSGHRLRLNSTRHILSLCLFPGMAVSHRPLRETQPEPVIYIFTHRVFLNQVFCWNKAQ